MTALKFRAIDRSMFQAIMAEAEAAGTVEVVSETPLATLYRVAEDVFVGIACNGTDPGHDHVYCAAMFVEAEGEDERNHLHTGRVPKGRN